MKLRPYLLLVVCIGFLSSCGTYFNQPYDFQQPRLGETINTREPFKNLPKPSEPVVVGVYNFKDQTGQYKAVETGSTFSTAVPQGATTMMIKALEDSEWFTPIERENLANLLNERNIIRTTREEYRRSNQQDVKPLPPLLFAGILLEGGIISYDTNIMTGGLGARYFGAGGSSQYRQDRITVYLRAVSTSTGKILKTVYVSKTILSQSIDASLFRFVSFQRLMEAETGFTRNEPVQLALKEAIEKSVEALIIEGIEEKIWKPEATDAEIAGLLHRYNKEKDNVENTLLFKRPKIDREHDNAFIFKAGLPFLNADFNDRDPGFSGSITYQKALNSHFGAGLTLGYYNLYNPQTFTREYVTYEANLNYDFIPYDNFGPFVYGGVGYIDFLRSEDSNLESASSLKLQVGAGLDFNISKRMSLQFFAENHFTFNDRIDGYTNGKRDDYFYNFGVGLKYKVGKNKIK